MEPNPPYLQHNHRYVPCSPNPPPPRPPMVHNSPNIYGPHHHLPPPPPPVPPSRHPLPAQSPPLPPPNISYQFSVRPNRNPNPNYPMEDTHHPRSTMKHHFPDVARSPRLSFGVPVDEDRPHHPNRYQHIYAESDPSWDGRAYPVGILDREPHQLQSDRGQFDQRAVSPYRPIEKIRQKFDGDVRFREGFERNPRREDFKRDRGNRNSHFDSSSRGWSEHGAASSRTYESNYDNRSHRRDSSKTENHRWAHTREVVREGNGVRRGLGTHEYYNSELERYDNKGGRGVNYEFDHTPKKQMQKKSVLLRIQKPKPSYRNREEDVSIFYDYVNDTTSIPFRGMEQHEYTDRGVEENTREGSPVELDVSFKSNSLVAKAVVPPSSFAVVTGANFAPRNSKIRKVEVSEKDCSNKSTVKLDRALCASKNTSTSNPVANPGIDNEHKSNSEPSSLELDVSRGKRKVERSSKVMQSGSSGKTNSTMVAKKKKIVKKVVKKVLNPRSRLLSSQPKEKLDEPVKADTSTLCQPLTSATDNFSTPSGENIAAVGLVSVHHTEFQPCPNDASVCGAYERVDGSPKTVVPEEVTGDVNCGGLNLQKSKRKWDDLTPRLDSSKDKHFKFDENSANADNSAHGLQTLYNPDKDCTGLQSEKMLLFSVEGFGKQGCQNESSVLLDSSSAAVSSEVMLSVGSIIDSSLLYSEKNMTQEHLMNTSSTNHELNSAVVIDRSSINSLGRSVNTDFETVGNVSCQTGTCQIDKTDDDGTVNGFSKTVSSVDDIIASKSLEETRIGYSRIATECCDQIASTIYSSRNSCFSSDETNLDTGDDIGNHPYQGGITILADGGVTVSSLDDPNLADGSEARSPNNQREVGSTHLHMLRSGLNNLHFAPINVVRSVPYVDTNLSLYFREPEVTISHVLAMGLGLQRCADGFGVIRGSSSIEGLLEAKTSSSNEVNVGLDEVPKKNEDDKRLSAGYMVPSGPITSAINEEPLADSSTSLVEEPSEIFGSSIQPEEVVAVSSMDTVCTADFSPRQEGITVGGSSKDVNSARDTFTNDGSNVYSYCKTEKFGIANMEYVCPSVLGCERVANVASVENNHLINIMSVENNEGEKTNLDADDAQIMICSKPAQIHIPAELHCLAVNQRNPHTEWRDESYLHHEGCLPSVSNHPSLLAHDEPVSTPYCNEEPMDIVPEVMDIVPEVSDHCSPLLTKELDSSFRQIGKDNIGQDDTNRHKKPVTTGGSNLSTQSSHSIEANIYSKRNPVMEKNQSSNGKALSSQESIITTHIRYPLSAESHGKKIHSSCAPPRIPGYSTAVYNASRSKSSSTHVAQPRTWHRTTTSAYPLSKIKPISSTVPPQRQFPTRSSKLLNNSYIWKGNSFVRKSPPVTVQSRGLRGLSSSVYQLNSLGTDEVKKSSGSESRVNVTDTSSTLGTGVLSASFERPKIPPSTITKIPNGSTTSSGVHPSSPLAETSNVSNETTSVKFAETNDALSAGRDLSKISETPVYITGSTNNSNNRNELSDGNLTSLNVKSITYVKRKSNQLIATSSPTDLCAHNAENTVTASSDGYYKRSRNQLIRNPLEGHAKRTVAMPDADLISKGLTTSVVLPGRSFGRRRNQKVLTKHGKSSNFSLVWRLGGAQLSNKNGSSLKHQVLPHLPWKRATYSRSFMQSPVSISNNSSLSTISRKLLTLRKRNTVYTRSRNGYSLRKFKVLSVGGCNLKWSKSIDRHSKKANEEATLAVAAVERERREQNGAACTVSGTKSRSHSSHKSYNNGGERIFRIGSLRYKMDSSRRTLQRISDNESSCSAALQTEKIMKNPYVPRRLVIDNNEYVRIGSGNQLIRDPKRRTRVLASEKVRWSLHTVRSRLAKKRKYCQFFTRFGRCNKDDGKCPYIHDSSKIAVCTKFLNGLCHNSNCKLTHKVIPERMPDCSYFLEGLCMNKSCPYRHVHVNPNAPTCEGFLRGYCADDNECRKKHSYLCPTFEATGSCPLGSKCKLHHPKNRIKGKKGKRSIEQKNARGRYFGSMRFDIFDSGKATFEMHSVQDGDDVPVEGKFTDFISIDDSDEDGECNDSTTEQIASSGSGPSDLRIDDLDELIKPIRIMNKNLTT